MPDTVFFRQRFRVAKSFSSARLQITADDGFRIFLNDQPKPVGAGSDWTTVQEFDVSRQVKVGNNLLSIEAVNHNGVGGLLYRLTVRYVDGKSLSIVSGRETRLNRRVPADWTNVALDDAAWQTATEIAPANGGFWGQLYTPIVSDPSQLVRVWDIQGTTPENPYSRRRNPGERMLMSVNVASLSDMQLLAQSGFTLFQTDSDHLSTEEIKPGQWNLSGALESREATRRLNLDWCYFTHFAFPPEWYRKTTPFTRLQCLEDKQPVEAFSLWEPAWKGFVDKGYESLASTFASKPANNPNAKIPPPLSAIYVGIHGDYGECGLMLGARVSVSGQKEDWQKRFGNMHNHLGWWCHDPLARADFRAEMLKKYGSLATLNAAWKLELKSEAEIDFPTAPRSEARRQWLDFVHWYQDSVGKAIEMNLEVARKHFPTSLLMLPLGFGAENPRGGNDNSLIPKIAAKHKAAVRSTHGGFKPFAENAATMFARIGSASRFYGTPFWSEPSSALTPQQETARIFESVSQGATGYFDWAGNALPNRDVYLRYGKFLEAATPVVDVAMFYPSEGQRLKPNEGYNSLFASACAYLRDFTNFDIVDDRMVLDGCLSRYRVLALWEGTICDQTTLDAIRSWVNNGGVLLAYDFGKVMNLDGETPWYTEKTDLFGNIQSIKPAQIRERYIGVVPPQYRLAVGDPNQPQISDYLAEGGEGWYSPETGDSDSSRWTKSAAGLLLPVNIESDYTLVVRAYVPQEAAALKRKVLINGQEVGALGSPGDITYRFVIPAGLLNRNRLATLTFQSETFNQMAESRQLGVQIRYVQMVERGTKEDAEALAPTGSIRRELDFSQLNTQWAQRFGKGMTIYFPATRKLLKGYIELIRRAVYYLNAIEPGRLTALNIDNEQDGVYATLFTDYILYYNSTDKPITKTLKFSQEMLDSWKESVGTPNINTWTITIPPHGIEGAYFRSEPLELRYECEEFTQLASLRLLSDPFSSPGTGQTCVLVPKGSSISTRISIEQTAEYAIHVRTTNSGKLEPVEVLVDDKPVSAVNHRSGQTILVGKIKLSRGRHTLTLRSPARRDFRADFIVLSTDTNVAGYDFVSRRDVFE